MNPIKKFIKKRKHKKAIKQFRLLAYLCDIPLGFSSDKVVEEVALNLFSQIYVLLNDCINKIYFPHVDLERLSPEKEKEQNEKQNTQNST